VKLHGNVPDEREISGRFSGVHIRRRDVGINFNL